MEKNRIFYQDFLMDIPVDDSDFPVVQINYTNSIDNIAFIDEPANILDYINDWARLISFQKLHDMSSEDDWNNLFYLVNLYKVIIIVDDIQINNSEVEEMKYFYLSVYYYNIGRHCNNVYVYLQNNI